MTNVTAGTTTMTQVYNGLVPIYEDQQTKQQLVDARELHGILRVGKFFANWIKDRISQCNLQENEDYVVIEVSPNSGKNPPNASLSEVYAEIGKNPLGGRPSKEYALTLFAAKHLAMMERNEMGFKVRSYFIQAEEELRKKSVKGFDPDSLSRLDILKMAIESEQERQQLALENKHLEAKLEEVIPKAEAAERFMNTEGLVGIRDSAKLLGMGSTTFSRLLRTLGITYQEGKACKPYQKYLNEGYFELKEVPVPTRYGDILYCPRTYVTNRGLVWLRSKLEKFTA